MKIEPLHDNVAVIQDEPENPGKLIIIPDTARKLSWKGRVLAVGPDVLDVVKDNKVLLPRYYPADMWMEDQHILFYREEEILGIIEEDDEK